MPKQRLQVDSGLAPVASRVSATPVDTFEHTTAGNKLAQLGAALGQLNPAIQRFGGVVADEVNSNAEAAGTEAARKLKEQGETLASATRKGLIPAQRNPFYMAGLREQLGRTAADSYAGDLRSAVAQDEGLRESTDLKDYDKFAADFKQKWTQTNMGDAAQEQHTAAAFGFRADQYDNRQRDEFAAGIEGKVVKQGNEATHQETVQAVMDGFRNNTDPTLISSSINGLVTDLVAQGRQPALVLQSVALALHDAAVADPDNSDKILKLAEGIKGKNGPLSTTSYMMSFVDRAETEVANKVQLGYSRDAIRAEAKKKTAVEGVIGQLTTALTNAGDKAHTIDLKPYREAMAQIAPEHVAGLDALQDAFVSHEFKEDPHVADDLLTRLYTVDPGEKGFVDMPEVGRAFGARQISKSTFLTMVTELEKRDKAGADKSVFKDPVFIAGRAAVGKLFANDLFDSEENRAKASSAQIEFTAAYIRSFAGKTGPEFDAAKNEFLAKSVGHELNDKGTKKQSDAFNAVPGPQTGPQFANTEKVLVLEKSQIQQMNTELGELIEIKPGSGGAHKRNHLSDPTLMTLMMYGVKPDPESVRKFLDAQDKLYKSGQRAPTP